MILLSSVRERAPSINLPTLVAWALAVDVRREQLLISISAASQLRSVQRTDVLGLA